MMCHHDLGRAFYSVSNSLKVDLLGNARGQCTCLYCLLLCCRSVPSAAPVPVMFLRGVVGGGGHLPWPPVHISESCCIGHAHRPLLVCMLMAGDGVVHDLCVVDTAAASPRLSVGQHSVWLNAAWRQPPADRVVEAAIVLLLPCLEDDDGYGCSVCTCGRPRCCRFLVSQCGCNL